jgi:hypothetical protein
MDSAGRVDGSPWARPRYHMRPAEAPLQRRSDAILYATFGLPGVVLILPVIPAAAQPPGGCKALPPHAELKKALAAALLDVNRIPARIVQPHSWLRGR